MHFLIVDTNQEFIDAAQEAFHEDDDVDFICADFRDIEGFEVLVSAANSFGIMDGGIDAAISEYFGWDLERRVQTHIQTNYLGQQPVGTAFLIETAHDTIPYLCHAPTMRVPESIQDTDNVYLAMRAVLLSCHHAIKAGADIHTIALCGLGTGVGEVDMETAAMQMALAYKHTRYLPSSISWEHALIVAKEINDLR